MHARAAIVVVLARKTAVLMQNMIRTTRRQSNVVGLLKSFRCPTTLHQSSPSEYFIIAYSSSFFWMSLKNREFAAISLVEKMGTVKRVKSLLWLFLLLEGFLRHRLRWSLRVPPWLPLVVLPLCRVVWWWHFWEEYWHCGFSDVNGCCCVGW